MDQPINAVLHFNERAKVRQIPDPPLNARAHLITFVQRLPGIILNLFHSQADSPGLWIYAEDFDYHFIAGVHKFAGMLNAFGPAHLGNMDQTFDAGFQFDEGAVVRHAGHLCRSIVC